MKKVSILLSVVSTTVIFSGCSVVDQAIGGVGSIHITRIELDVSSDSALRKSDQSFGKDRDVFLDQVRTVARNHNFMDKTLTIGIVPKPIAYFETPPPWLCYLKVLETNGQLTVELRQYYEKRKKTRLYKDTETALVNELVRHFSGRLEVRSQRQLRYPW